MRKLDPGPPLALLVLLGGVVSTAGCGQQEEAGSVAAELVRSNAEDPAAEQNPAQQEASAERPAGEGEGATRVDRKPREDSKGPRIELLAPIGRAAVGDVLFGGRLADQTPPCTMTVNGIEVPVAENLTWEIYIPLEMGEHKITYEARDALGNIKFGTSKVVVYPGADKDRGRTTYVHDATELLSALESNRVVVLADGEYELGELEEVPHDHVRWDDGPEGKRMVVHSLTRFVLVGSAELSASIVGRDPELPTLTLAECDGIEFRHVRLASEPADGVSLAPNVIVRDSYDVLFDGCELSGGTVGLRYVHNNLTHLVATTVRDCSEAFVTLKNSKHAGFADSSFLESRPAYGFSVDGRGTYSISFSGCRVLDNDFGDGTIFELEDGNSQILFEEGVIRGNRAAALTLGKGVDRLVTRKSEVQSFEGD